MEVVKMVTKVAGEEVFVGECHPARARVLVKRQLASWMDGKVLLHVLNVHDKLLASNPEAARGPLDDENVSKQEMERRLAWFRSFMERSSRALVAGTVELPTVEEAAKSVYDSVPRLSDEGRAFVRGPIEERLRSFFAENRSWDDREVFLASVRKDAHDAVMAQMMAEGVNPAEAWQVAGEVVDEAHLKAIPDDEVDVFFMDEVDLDPVDPGVWETEPDVSAMFGPDWAFKAKIAALVSPRDDIKLDEPTMAPSPPPFDVEAYKQGRERDARLLAAQQSALEEAPRPVATLRQVMAVHARTPSGNVRVRLTPQTPE